MARLNGHSAIRIIPFLIGLYLFLSLSYLFAISLIPMRDGLVSLSAGQRLLLSDPPTARKEFETAGVFFSSSSERLQNVPFIIKVVTYLPPFRWNVRLLKAASSLSLAGQEATGLISDFPILTPETSQNINDLLSTSSGSYLTWYADHTEEATAIRHYVTDSDQQLEGIPDWILFGKRSQLQQLKADVKILSTQLSTAQDLTEGFGRTFGMTDQSTHSTLILLEDPAHTFPFASNSINYAFLTGKNGVIEKIEYGTEKPLPLTPKSQRFDEAAPEIATAYQVRSSTPIDTVIRLDTHFISRFLELTGPLDLTNKTVPQANKDSTASTFSTPVLLELVPLLVNKITARSFSETALIFTETSQNQQLQIWSKDSGLEDILHTLLGNDTSPQEE